MIDRNETYRSRLLAYNGESKDHIGLLSNKLPCIARIERGTPINYRSRLSTLHPHSALWEELSSLDEAFPVVAIGFSAYLLFCRTEVGGEVGYHNFDNWEYVSKEQCYQLYIDKLFYIHKEANKELYSIKVANGKTDEFKANFLSSLCHEEKAHLKRSMELGYIDTNIIKGTKEFLASLTMSEEEQANEQTYKYVSNGIRFDKVYNILKERKLLQDNASLSDFIYQIRNGHLDLIKVKIYKVLIALALKGKMGKEWYEEILFSADTTPQQASHINKSKEVYQTFSDDLNSIL
jgi:hypothetical protein